MLWPITSQTIPDCIRYIIGVFCFNFKSQMNILVHINTLACVKAEIWPHAMELTLLITFMTLRLFPIDNTP